MNALAVGTGRAVRRGGLVALALALVVVVVGQTSTAWAYVKVAYAPRGLVMTERPPTSLGEVRATLTLTLAAGEARLLRAESKVYDGYPDRNAIGQKITCERPDGTILKESWTGTNLLARNGLTPVSQRLLFVAPTAGTYHCRLRVYVNSHYATPGRATLYSGFVGDVQGTLTTQRLGISRQTYGVQMFEAGDTTVRKMAPIFRYLPPAGATKIDARSDVYLTNCYGPGGAGCPRRTFPAKGSSTFAVQSFLVPANPACRTVATTRTVKTFDYQTHHIGQSLDMTAPLPTGVNCGAWTTYTSVQWLAGLPFVVHLYPYSQSSIIGS
ncbi:hypothetical protein GCM10022415_03520 [Knoellia locipacati]|uniref:Uncharacterized protein n=1 Tax=Knoellia locipacati TaxID=882824 RepID=A0A512SWJ9_9MICO|nr:hypothetical protein [Knoellia locipacati]GEQ12304.1 hypothetical protein KLO01_03510 [Knoellia locipacati]